MADAESVRLLELASDPSSLPTDASLPDWLTPLLDAAKRSHREHPDAAPQTERRNASGSIVVRAYRLDALARDARSAIYAFMIEHDGLLAQSLDAACTANQLSKRQCAVCIEMLHGASYAEIGRTLGIKESTVIDHVRRIYEKLNIHSRDELEDKLR